jgi:hypothetical protein
VNIYGIVTFYSIGLAGLWANSLKADDYQGTELLFSSKFKVLPVHAT